MKQSRHIFQTLRNLTGCIDLDLDTIKLYFKEESYGSYRMCKRTSL